MAFILALRKAEDFSPAAITYFDLSSYTNGFDLAEGGWIPAIASNGDLEVEEVLTLMVKSTTVDGLATALQNLYDRVNEAKYYENGIERYGIWLCAQLVGETNVRQALIKLIKPSTGSPFATRQVEAKYFIKEFQLGLIRTPWWEGIVPTLYQPTSLNLVGGTFNYTTYVGSPGTVVGDVSARIALMKIMGHLGSGGILDKLWFGFRTDRYGTLANFQSYWSLRKAAIFDADTTGGVAHADATAKDGFKTITTFATVATLIPRAYIRVTDVTANPADQRGSYTVLLRAKNSAAGTTRVRLKDGMYYSLNYRTQARVAIASTSWLFYELGTVSIPSPGRLINGTSEVAQYAMVIDAERISGACSLEMDCLVLIPNNEGYIFTEDAPVDFASSLEAWAMQYIDGRSSVVARYSGVAAKLGTIKASGGLPTGVGIVVAAGQRETVSTLADHVDLDIHALNRWAILRGAEGLAGDDPD